MPNWSYGLMNNPGAPCSAFWYTASRAGTKLRSYGVVPLPSSIAVLKSKSSDGILVARFTADCAPRINRVFAERKRTKSTNAMQMKIPKNATSTNSSSVTPRAASIAALLLVSCVMIGRVQLLLKKLEPCPRVISRR